MLHKLAWGAVGQIHRHPRMEMLFTLRPMHTVMTWLGSFGAPTPKPIRLWSSEACATCTVQRDGNCWPLVPAARWPTVGKWRA